MQSAPLKLSDTTIALLEKVAKETDRTPSDIAEEAIEAHLFGDGSLHKPDPDTPQSIAAKLIWLDNLVAEAWKVSAGRSQQDIDDEIREFRSDR